MRLDNPAQAFIIAAWAGNFFQWEWIHEDDSIAAWFGRGIGHDRDDSQRAG
jgi:hypothetical protein